MASEKPKKEKKDKKEKKRSETEGVHKAVKKDKKDKKDKKGKLEEHIEEHLAAESPSVETPAAATAEDVEMDAEKPVIAKASLVPFALPLADDKAMKKVLKATRKAARNNTLKRGVKEVVKTLRKSAAASPSNTGFPGIVVIAADISPMDVISHIPVLCEDHNVPFIFVTSRAELGAAAKTKRPTSVVMLMESRPAGKKAAESKDKDEDDTEDYAEVYQGLVKLIQKEAAKQCFW
ncbi:ribosomal protein L7Ae/L30e/S12e/Gadd45 [Ceratocystis lukuohia]|uniref:H/ACA ribonucleoprotein complex subunit 2 n=2 Tax=Ceratocystis TaxID=5157 RepID=A0A0F8B506_CERFI|nr:H/ACA ribonucleoprotein complex subunit 2 [Ceratocystis platani]